MAELAALKDEYGTNAFAIMCRHVLASEEDSNANEASVLQAQLYQQMKALEVKVQKIEEHEAKVKDQNKHTAVVLEVLQARVEALQWQLEKSKHAGS